MNKLSSGQTTKGRPLQGRRLRSFATDSAWDGNSRSIFIRNFWHTLFIVLPLAVVTAFICFYGQSPLRLHIAPRQVVNSSVVATIPFTYESHIQTQQLKDRKALRIAPVYQIDLQQFKEFKRRSINLLEDLNVFDKRWSDLENADNRYNEINIFTQILKDKYGIEISPWDLETILAYSDSSKRAYLMSEGLNIVQNIQEQGVTDSSLQDNNTSSNYFMNIDLGSQSSGKKLRTQEDALLFLRIHMNGLDDNRELTTAFLHILRGGITPNLTYDKVKTDEKRDLITNQVKPVIVTVELGETIIDEGDIATPLQYEKFLAYRNELAKSETHYLGLGSTFFSGFGLSFIILLCAGISFKILFQNEHYFKRFAFLLIFLFTLNLLLLRGFNFLCDWKLLLHYPTLFRTIPLSAPVTFGVILATLLCGRRSGIFLALLIGIFYTLLLGKSLDFLTTLLFALLLAVYLTSGIFFRSQILRVGLLSGFILGLAALWMTSFDSGEWRVAIFQFLGSCLSGLLNGLLAMFFLSFCEKIFKLTSNIQLQELSNFNHRLLRHLQIYAPGSYHHSLMVASIAEKAAYEVGANGLLCRVGALFHDLGKIAKPLYFTENQLDGNPHLEKSPRISTLIIKNHVREGVELARTNKLPEAIIDLTRQHHGTTLIQYFYQQAIKEYQQQSTAEGNESASLEKPDIDESFYRYDGPKPQTIEAAILMLSDSIEAASRSLQKVTPQSVENLVNSIAKGKVDDHQFDECPMTYKQMRQICDSISSNLLRMLHTRISYAPKGRMRSVTNGNKENQD